MVIPTRRREATMPIDSRTRTASRATLRETAYSAPMASSVSTCPTASAPEAIRPPSASRTLACWPGGRPVG